MPSTKTLALTLVLASSASAQVVFLEPAWIPVPQIVLHYTPAQVAAPLPAAAQQSAVIERYFVLPNDPQNKTPQASTDSPKPQEDKPQQPPPVIGFYLPALEPVPAKVIIREYYIPNGAMLTQNKTTPPSEQPEDEPADAETPEPLPPEKLTPPEWSNEFEKLPTKPDDDAGPNSPSEPSDETESPEAEPPKAPPPSET